MFGSTGTGWSQEWSRSRRTVSGEVASAPERTLLTGRLARLLTYMLIRTGKCRAR